MGNMAVKDMTSDEIAETIKFGIDNMHDKLKDEKVAVCIVAMVRKHWEPIEDTFYMCRHSNTYYHDSAAFKEYVGHIFLP